MLTCRIPVHYWRRTALIGLLAAGVVTLAAEAKRSQYDSAGGSASFLSKATKMAECRAKITVYLPFVLAGHAIRVLVHAEYQSPLGMQTRPMDSPLARPQLRSPPPVV